MPHTLICHLPPGGGWEGANTSSHSILGWELYFPGEVGIYSCEGGGYYSYERRITIPMQGGLLFLCKEDYYPMQGAILSL